MHDFERRMEQALAAMSAQTAGRRTRLSRPLRQSDANCWPTLADKSLDAAILAAMRVISHELLETLCLQLEALLAECASDHERAFVMAVYAVAQGERWQVSWRRRGPAAGCSFPASESLVILLPEKAGATEATFRFELRPTSASTEIPSGRSITVNIGEQDANPHATIAFTCDQVAEDPFRCARAALALL